MATDKGPLDGFFGSTNVVLLVLLGVCCSGIGLILGIIGLVTGKDETAKKNAMLVTIIAGIMTALGTIGYIASMFMSK